MSAIRKSAASGSVSSTRKSAASDEVKLSRIAVGDRGLKAKFDAKLNGLVISGTARGVETRDPYDPAEKDPYLQTEEFGGGIGLDFDKDRMPKFDTSNGFTEKNKWYFAHSVSVGTTKGQTPVQVARSLAAKINETDGYNAKVKTGSNGSALVQISRS